MRTERRFWCWVGQTALVSWICPYIVTNMNFLGYPLRVIIPGYVGARSVKWIDRIIVTKEETTGTHQKSLKPKTFLLVIFLYSAC